ncbi:MAG: hypothetical protein V4675_01325 [Verrucomicrobiota bacterium]
MAISMVVPEPALAKLRTMTIQLDLPARVAPLLTVVGLAVLPSTCKVPALTVVLPITH